MADGSVSKLLEHGPADHLFLASEADAWEFVREFVKSYQALPTVETLEAHTGTSLVPHSEPAGYYFDLMKARHTERKLKSLMKEVQQKLAPEAYDPDAALGVVIETAMSLVTAANAKQLADFRHSFETLKNDYVAKNQEAESGGLMLGWPSVDKETGGLIRGDVLSMVGRPAAGKTFQMLFGAMHGWLENGRQFLATGVKPDQSQSRLFVSMEMSLLPIQQRMGAMATNLAVGKIKKGALGTKLFNAYKEGLSVLEGFPDPFWIVDGNLTATVDDIFMLARQLKPDAIFIDGAYLLQHPTERDRFRRVAENADLIKKQLAPIAPVACSWQFAKTASKKKKGEKVTGDDVGYSDAIFQVSSLMLGLLQDDSVETINQRKIEILKGRNGETGSFMTKWDFDKMDFREIVEAKVDELQFL